MASVVKKTLHLDLAEMLKEDKPAEEVRQKIYIYICISLTLRIFVSDGTILDHFAISVLL